MSIIANQSKDLSHSKFASPVVSIITMGCAKNEVDSNAMASKLSQAGYVISDDPQNADAIIVNTCSFIQSATEESIEAILEAADLLSNQRDQKHLIVAGCMASRYGADLETELPEVSCFIPCAKETSIVEQFDALFNRQSDLKLSAPNSYDLSKDSVSAYVKISDGCDRFCSYCTIPYIRGRYHSFPYSVIEQEVSSQVDAGKKEIILIAQDSGRWGEDFEKKQTLADLVSSLAKRFPNTWFRMMYIQPEGITDELIKAVADHHNICNYFDIPFQHVNADLLKSMNRKGSASEYLELIQKIRSNIDDVALRTTLMVGYPGETEEMFEELLDFVEEASLDYVGAFAYSREEGTRAFDLPDQIDEDEKLFRLQQLRDLADSISSNVIASRIGQTETVLICGTEEDGQLFGRSASQAPEVDGLTYIDTGNPGQFVQALIEDTLFYEMEGAVIHD